MEYTRAYLEQIETIVQKQEVADALAAAGSVQEIVRIFAAENVIVEEAMAQALLEKRDELKDTDEMPEEVLEMVSGGSAYTFGVALGTSVAWAIFGNKIRNGIRAMSRILTC